MAINDKLKMSGHQAIAALGDRRKTLLLSGGRHYNNTPPFYLGAAYVDITISGTTPPPSAYFASRIWSALRMRFARAFCAWFCGVILLRFFETGKISTEKLFLWRGQMIFGSGKTRVAQRY
jgi:hypothetical protein